MAKASSVNRKLPDAASLNSLLRNAVVVIVCVLGMGASLWFLRRDLAGSMQRTGSKPAGAAYWVKDNVKRLSVRRTQWERLERYYPIYDGDVISTDVFSGAVIGFGDGATLELSEHTTVRMMGRDSSSVRLVLGGGEILVKTKQDNVSVTISETSSVESSSSDPRINLTPGATAGIKFAGNGAHDSYFFKVYQGSGTFTARGASNTVEGGKALMLGRDGAIRSEPPVVMLTPQNGARLLHTLNEKVPVEFRWKRLNPLESSIRLVIARTGDFSKPEGIWYWENTDSGTIELSEGIYHWKIYTPSSQEEADSGWLDIVRTQGLRALAPADGSVIILPPGKREVRFSWTVPEEAEAVVLEVSDNSEMLNPKIKQLVNRTSGGRGSYVNSDLGSGQWFWRIQTVFSESGELYIADQGSGFPRINTRGVNSFTLQESANLPIQEVRTATTLAKPVGSPYLLFPPDNYMLEATRTPDILYTWGNTAPNDARFQMSELSDFSGALIKNYEVSGFNMQGPYLKPGTYYWRIAGNDPGNPSHPNRLVVLPALPSPPLESPKENERLLVQEGVAVKFTWNRVYYANNYQFNLYLEGRELPLRGISSLQNNTIYVYFDPNTQGRFFWTIQGFTTPTEFTTGRNGLIARGQFYISPAVPQAGADQISWSIPRIANMQAYAGDVDSPITLISPIQGANIPGLQALHSPPMARWVSEEPLRNMQLIVSRTTDPSSDPMSIVRNVAGTSAIFPSLSEGVWYWIIRGDTADSRGTTPGDPFWFNVLPIPLLPAPTVTLPESKAIIGIEQLTRDRNITFRWNLIEGASAYIFSLYQDEDTPKLLYTTSPQMNPYYTFENISLLNDGNYFWQIEAVRLDRNGVIEQRGGTAQYFFTIDIQRSNNLRTTTQGAFYGQ